MRVETVSNFYLPESRQLVQVAQSLAQPETREREVRALTAALQSLGLEDGSDVQVEVDISRSALVITPYVQPVVPGLDAEFSHQVEDFLAHYRPALEELNRS